MPASLPFSKAFDFASGATGERFQNPFWKMKEYFFGARFRKAVFEVKKFGNELVSAAMHKRREARKTVTKIEPAGTDPAQNNLINLLLDHIEDRQVVADAAMNYLSAGAVSIIHYTQSYAHMFRRERYDRPVSDLDLLSSHAKPKRHEKDRQPFARHLHLGVATSTFIRLHSVFCASVRSSRLQRKPPTLPSRPHRAQRMYRTNDLPGRHLAAKRRRCNVGHVGYGPLKEYLG